MDMLMPLAGGALDWWSWLLARVAPRLDGPGPGRWGACDRTDVQLRGRFALYSSLLHYVKRIGTGARRAGLV